MELVGDFDLYRNRETAFRSDEELVGAAALLFGDNFSSNTASYWNSMTNEDAVLLLQHLFDNDEVPSPELMAALQRHGDQGGWATIFSSRLSDAATTVQQRWKAWRFLCALSLTTPQAQRAAIGAGLSTMLRSVASFDHLVRGLANAFPNWRPSGADKRRLREARKALGKWKLSPKGNAAYEAVVR